MPSRDLVKPLLGGLLLALAIYIGGFAVDQHLRTRRGPWVVIFTTEPSGAPAILVNQPKLNIGNLKIVFAGETATHAAGKVAFDFPQKPVPFGRVKFEDLTYLPGTVTFDFFGHEIELLPRVLVVNKKEVPWKSESVLELSPTNKLAQPPKPPKGRIGFDLPGANK